MRKTLIYMLVIIFCLAFSLNSESPRKFEKNLKLNRHSSLQNRPALNPKKQARLKQRYASYSAAQAGEAPSAPDRILVKYKTGRTNAAQRDTIRSRYGMKTQRHLTLTDTYVYQLSSSSDKPRVLRELNKNPEVAYAEPDYLLSLYDTVPNDTSFTSLWGMNNTGQTGGTADADIDAVEAWDYTTGGNDVIVAVIDTGVDYNHPDLAANMWTNPGETPGDNIDNDGNGYIDDVYGVNAITNGGDPLDDHNHGTHCSGTIGGVGNNGVGVAGVCWTVKIMACKFLSSSGSGYTSNAIECVQYAVDNGAHIMSNSWGGGGFSQGLFDAITAAKNAGILFVAAAGNSGSNNDVSPHYPSSYDVDNVLAVAATDHNDNKASFSCYGATSVDIGAPGVSIYSTTRNNSYASYSGTSMATPHVAGLAALIKSLDPALTWSELKDTMMQTVDPLPALDGKVISGGRINAFSAISMHLGPGFSITQPEVDSVNTGSVSIQAQPEEGEDVVKVEFYIDGQLKSTDTTAPFEYTWDTTLSADGRREIMAKAYNSQNQGTPIRRNVWVNNSGSPLVAIVNPLEGATLKFQVSIQADAAYQPGISKVEFFIDGVKAGEDTTFPYSYDWDTLQESNGQHVLKAKAIGIDAQFSEDQITVTTNNDFLPEAERNALLALFNQTDGPNWWYQDWKNPDGTFKAAGTESTWYGITIENEHVVEIDLAYNDLTGPIPPELANLTQLRELALYWNYLSGTIPTELGSLTLLEYLDLDENELTGTIPTELGNLANLNELWLDDNDLTGGIPPELGNLSKLEYLFLYWCPLGGTIPAELGNLSLLRCLEADDCQLTGTIPPELGDLSELYVLYLDDNNLTGSIPTELGNLDGMLLLSLSGNQLSGGIPAELGNMTSLYYLSLYKSGISGPIPTELSNAANLRYLYLHRNRLTGSIPTSLANLTNMLYLRINRNSLYTDDETLRQYLDAKEPGWHLTQTIAPPDIWARGQSATSIMLTWSPIDYTADAGGYRVYTSTAPGGPYTLYGTTAAKTVTSMPVNGLTTGSTHYFTIQTVTEANTVNPFSVESEISAEVSGVVQAPSITVISPNGGEAWMEGQSRTISWTSDGYTGTINIAYSTAGPGGTFIPIASAVADSGSYSWFLPEAESNQCLVRITATGSSAADTSDNLFSMEPSPEIVLTAPNGNGIYIVDNSIDITWTYNNVSGDVLIQLIKGAGTVAGTLGTVPVADQHFQWTVPAGTTVGNDYRIRLSSTTPALEDLSDAYFAIVALQTKPDFNKDGKADLVWRHDQYGYNMIWMMNNTGVLQSKSLLRVKNTAWYPAGLDDFNGDGYVDILWRNNQTGSNILWYMQNHLLNGSASLPRVGDVQWVISGTADFNRDGHPDILFRHSQTGRNIIWYMNGKTRVGYTYITRVADMNWQIGGLGDFNHDGYTDILWRHKQDGNNLVWFMQNKTRTGTAWLPRIKSTWQVAGLADMNSDGHVDIIWRHDQYGYDMIWYMNRTALTSSAQFNRVKNPQWEIVN